MKDINIFNGKWFFKRLILAYRELSLSGLLHVKLLSDSTAGVEQQKTIDSPDSHLLLFGKSGLYEGLRVFFHRKAC